MNARQKAKRYKKLYKQEVEKRSLYWAKPFVVEHHTIQPKRYGLLKKLTPEQVYNLVNSCGVQDAADFICNIVAKELVSSIPNDFIQFHSETDICTGELKVLAECRLIPKENSEGVLADELRKYVQTFSRLECI